MDEQNYEIVDIFDLLEDDGSATDIFGGGDRPPPSGRVTVLAITGADGGLVAPFIRGPVGAIQLP